MPPIILLSFSLNRAKLKENAPPGVIITQMIAHDLDSAKNGDIVYEFSDEEIDSLSSPRKIRNIGN